MNKRLKNLFFLVFAAFAFFSCSQTQSEGLLSVTIVHVNDLHGRVDPGEDGVGGFSHIAAALKKLRQKDPNLIFLISGDLITGSPLSSLTKGEAIFRLANRLGVSAFVPGNHEFDYGVPQYKNFLKIANFPFIAANMSIEDHTIPAHPPYIVLNAGDVKVGVIGIAHPDTPLLTLPENTRGIAFEDAAPTLRKIIPEVTKKAQLIVAITHIGLQDDRKLAREVGGINLILGGHSHDRLDAPEKIGNTWIAQTGHNARFLGVIYVKISKSSKKIVSLRGMLIRMEGPSDHDMTAAIAAEEARLPFKLDQPIGRATAALDKDADLAPWIAGLLKKYTGAEIGMVNKGGVRENLRPGQITYRDIFDVMPFDNKAVLAFIPGDHIRRWLDNQAVILDRNVKIDPNKTYRVGTMDYVASLYRIAPEKVRKTDSLVRDIMIEEIKNRGVIP